MFRTAPFTLFTKRLRNKLASAVLLLYFAAYLPLTAGGSYAGPYVSGKRRIFSQTWAVLDHYVWRPKFIVWERFDFNFLGALYCPLVLLDRYFWHHDKPAQLDPVLEMVP